MKLRKPCVHLKYCAHPMFNGKDVSRWRKLPEGVELCPGGVFLPDDTLVIEKVDGEWPEWAKEILTYDFLVRDAE